MSVNLGENKISDIVKATEGTGGTSNYNDLTNKPQINGVTLTGNLTTEDLNIDVSNIDAYTKQETDNLIDSKIAAAGTTKADTTYVDNQLNLKADKSTVETSLAAKANTSDVYTKDETASAISSAITGKADTTYVDNQLSLKSDKSNTYTKTEVDNSISSLSTTINNKLNNKADKSTTYTKEETTTAINNAITGKADTTYVDGQLELKADKTDTYTKEEIDDLLEQPNISGDTLPIGTMILWSGTTTPQNWLLCDGREVSRETYSELFAIIGTTWGAGDGSTSFNLPNYVNKFPLGAGGDVDLAETGGEKEHTLTVDELAKHTHTGVVDSIGNKLTTGWGSGSDNTSVIAVTATQNMGRQVYTVSSGGGQAHNNMPPYTGSYYIIKAKQSAGVVATVVDTLESTSTTDALSANMGRKLKDLASGIVYETTLEEDSSSIVVDNLDIVADGGEYEFDLLANADKSSEVEIKIDNFINSYFNIINYVADSTDGSHTITPGGSYQPNEDAIKGWLYLADSEASSYFSVTRGKIWCIDGKTNYHIEHSLALRSRHSLSDIRGLIGVDNNNINSLTFSATEGAKFKAGTKLIIRKTKNINRG